LQNVFGLQNAILFCLLLFVAAMVFVIPVNERRGIAAAERWSLQHENTQGGR